MTARQVQDDVIEEIRRNIHEIKTHIVGDFNAVGLNERVHRLEYAVKWMKGLMAAIATGLGAWLVDHFHFGK